MFLAIRPSIRKFLRRPEVALKLEETNIRSRWEEIIEGIHKGAKDKSQALYVTEHNELVVRVADHVWLHEIAFSREEIMKKVRKEYRSIKSIRFVA